MRAQIIRPYNVDLSAAIANLGKLAGGTQVRFSLSTGGGVTYLDLTGSVSTGTIAPGSTVVVSLRARNLNAGSYFVRITADPGAQVQELDETNNTSVFSITVP